MTIRSAGEGLGCEADHSCFARRRGDRLLEHDVLDPALEDALDGLAAVVVSSPVTVSSALSVAGRFSLVITWGKAIETGPVTVR